MRLFHPVAPPPEPHWKHGCLGVYAGQAITYEPPPEIDGRLTPPP